MFLFLGVDTVGLGKESKLELLFKIFPTCVVNLVASWKSQMTWCPGTDTRWQWMHMYEMAHLSVREHRLFSRCHVPDTRNATGLSALVFSEGREHGPLLHKGKWPTQPESLGISPGSS